MKLPRFWNDTGGCNDTVVTFCITISLVLWGLLAWKLHLWWLMLAAVLLGPLTGFVIGFSIVTFLCTYCNARDKE